MVLNQLKRIGLAIHAGTATRTALQAADEFVTR
jgi:hypothetical protein